MSGIEAALRGGAVALLALLVLGGLREWRRSAAARYGALFTTSVAAYVVQSAPGEPFQHATWLIPLRLISIGTPAVFWLWASACFDDEFRPSWDKFLPWVVLVGLGALCIFGGWPVAGLAMQTMALLLAGLAVWQALTGLAGDLVEARRRLRVILAIGAGLYIAAITLAELMPHHGGRGLPGTTLNAAGLAAMAFAFALMRLFEMPGGALATRALQPDRPAEPKPADPQERALLDALRRLMEDDKVYREEGLSIAALAARLGTPEYRLRRLINQRLTHRNFRRLPPRRGKGRTRRSQPSRGSDPDDRSRRRVSVDRALQSRLQGRNRDDAERVPARPPRRVTLQRRCQLSARRFWNRRAAGGIRRFLVRNRRESRIPLIPSWPPRTTPEESAMATLQRVFLYAVPVVIALAALEALARSFGGRRNYNWRAYFASLTDLLVRQYLVYTLLPLGLADPVIAWAWTHRVATVPLGTIGAFAALFLGQEFCYYWFHRAGHRMRWLWASHAVHHSPNQLNLSAAYRFGWTGRLSGTAMFFVPLVRLGFPPRVVFATLSLNLLYQFWPHVDWIPKLGPLELVFNTPSHHRVHHAANPEYLDANYGGVLIIFDRLFGTLRIERHETPCRYGLVEPLSSNNPVWIAFHEWVMLARDLWTVRNWREGWRALFGPPSPALRHRASPITRLIPGYGS